jgi:hypothetical protein
MENRLIQFKSEAESTPIKIVADAAIAVGAVGEGRLLPLLVLDTSQRPDIDALVTMHPPWVPGEVESSWIRMPGGRSRVGLLLSFSRPAELNVVIEFVVRTHGGLVDQIARARGFYLQPGKPGARPDYLSEHSSLLVEVAAEFGAEWDRILLSELQRGFRQEGMSRAEARSAAVELVASWRKLTETRMRP